MKESINHFGVDPIFIFQALANNSTDYIYLWNCKDDTYLASANLAEDFGVPAKGGSFRKMVTSRIYAKDSNRVTEKFHEITSQQKVKMALEYQIANAKGNYVWVSNRSTVQYDENGEAQLVIGVLHNLAFDGTVDSVTGLLMSNKCKEIFDLVSQSRLQMQGSVMLLGIDDFSTINTLNNHMFGDLVLRNMVQGILSMIDDDMYMYRFDGDQFLIVADKKTKEEMLVLYAQIKEFTTTTQQLNGTTYRFGVSAGIASFPEDGFTWIDIEKAVSIALKQAKADGKNRCVTFTKQLLADRMHEQTLSNYLANSIDQGFVGFKTVFQPVCHTQTLKIKGAEVLLRFETPQQQLISPMEFIPLLEQSQLIIPVGLWVMEQAFIACREWLQFCPDFVMNINVSYIQLRDMDFCDKVETLLKKYDLSTKHITLELTETYFISDAPNIRASLERLQELHLQIAMDDFGTGYSSLARLAEFNVDVVKIDRAFVQSLHKSKYNHDFIDSVVRLCHNVGMKVCVEGVETREEQASISLLNVDFIQGFYVSRPISKEDFFTRFLRQPYASEKLVVKPDMQLHHERIVKDQDVLLAMMDACPLALNFWNREFEIVACNEEALRLFEVASLDEFRRNFFQFSPEYQADGIPTVERAERLINEAFKGVQQRVLWTHCSYDNEIIPAEVTLVRIPYMNDYIVASYTRDMRNQVMMQNRIRQFNERTMAILDATPLCVNLWNKRFDNIMSNKEAMTLFNLSSKEEYREKFFSLSPQYQPDGRLSDEKAIEKIKLAFETGLTQFFWMHQDMEQNEIPCEITLVEIESLDDDGGSMVAGYTRDIREQLNAERMRVQASERIQAVLDSMPLSCVLISMSQDILDCNQSIVNLFQAKSKADIIENFYTFFPLKQPDGSISVIKKDEMFAKAFREGNLTFEWVYQSSTGENIPCEVTLSKVVLEKEEIYVAYSRDLRELQKTLEINDRLSKLAYYDLLTGAASRLRFMQKLEENFKKFDVKDDFALIIFDLDYFKSVNDTYGHAMGDIVLRKVVKCVESALPEDSILGRYGGDEFMIQCCGLSQQQLLEMMQEIVKEVEQIEFFHEDINFTTTISAGGCMKNMHDKSFNDMLKRADKVLYEVKEKGRNSCMIER